MNPLDGPATTEDDTSHRTDPDAAGSDGSSEYSSDSETYDPRRALATTATMQSEVSETATMDTDDEEESLPSRRQVRLLSPLAAWLLPRSSKTALAVSVWSR